MALQKNRRRQSPLKKPLRRQRLLHRKNLHQRKRLLLHRRRNQLRLERREFWIRFDPAVVLRNPQLQNRQRLRPLRSRPVELPRRARPEFWPLCEVEQAGQLPRRPPKKLRPKQKHPPWMKQRSADCP